nr:hypothetical protein [Neorhizobium tomejilense]
MAQDGGDNESADLEGRRPQNPVGIVEVQIVGAEFETPHKRKKADKT